MHLTPPHKRRRRGQPADQAVPCAQCGFDLRATRPDGQCPECGGPAREGWLNATDPPQPLAWLHAVERAVLAQLSTFIACPALLALAMTLAAAGEGATTQPIWGSALALMLASVASAVAWALAQGEADEPTWAWVRRLGLALAGLTLAWAAVVGAGLPFHTATSLALVSWMACLVACCLRLEPAASQLRLPHHLFASLGLLCVLMLAVSGCLDGLRAGHGPRAFVFLIAALVLTGGYLTFNGSLWLLLCLSKEIDRAQSAQTGHASPPSPGGGDSPPA